MKSGGRVQAGGRGAREGRQYEVWVRLIGQILKQNRKIDVLDSEDRWGKGRGGKSMEMCI